MSTVNTLSRSSLSRDLSAGLVVFLVALPLCLGVALACGAPLFAGVLSGVVGGILVGLLSGSHTSVSGPSPAYIAVVASQLVVLGSFEAFLLAGIVSGVIQIALGLARAGFIAAFFPSSVIKGLLAAIGVLLILKQIPHMLGHDTDPDGEMAFDQPDHENTFSELVEVLFDIHPTAAAVGVGSLVLLFVWDNTARLKKSAVPAPLVVVLLGVLMTLLFRKLGGSWVIQSSHLVQVPVAESLAEFRSFLRLPDFTQWTNPAVYWAGLAVAMVTSLETLLNLEAVDKIDPQQRTSPPSRELLAQGAGNVAVGFLGGLPIASVIVRSSININAGAQTKRATIFHGCLLLACVMLFPEWLNLIPLSCLAAILVFTGTKLASPELVRQMWQQGRYQFIPFVLTVMAIVLTDLVTGALVGLAISVSFILNSNLRRPVRRFVEKHLGGDVLHIELANQVSFLNRAALAKILDSVPRGGQVLLDAQSTDYIDPDVLSLIRDFKDHKAPARGVQVSFIGFRNKYELRDRIQYVDYSTRELQDALTPAQVLQILKDGHERFRTGHRLTRVFNRQVTATAQGQHPLAVVLGCIDSRSPAELIFDVGVGDIFSVRVAGNVISRKVLGSIEYACAVAHAKLVVVLGHTRCGAVTAAVDLLGCDGTAAEATGCQHAEFLLQDIQQSIGPQIARRLAKATPPERQELIDDVARINVLRTAESILRQSSTLAKLAREGRIAIVCAMYDVTKGDVTFLDADLTRLSLAESASAS
jgi:carbonic anhydrase/SulP family sulfate permease